MGTLALELSRIQRVEVIEMTWKIAKKGSEGKSGLHQEVYEFRHECRDGTFAFADLRTHNMIFLTKEEIKEQYVDYKLVLRSI